MATPTYDLLDSVTLSSSASSVTFSSIDQSYRDLVLVVNWSSGTTQTAVDLQFNSDTGANYSRVRMLGDGSSAGSTASSGDTRAQITQGGSPNTTQRASVLVQLMDYSATDKHKSYLVRNDLADTGTIALAGRWANTSAITQIYVYSANAATYAAGSTFYLYGVAA